jgi:hypothetical protein
VVFPSLALLGRLSPLYHSPSRRSQFLLRERERERERERGNEEEDILVRKRLKTLRPYVLLSFYTKATWPSICIVLF